MFWRLILFALLLTTACASAATQKFEASTLKYLYKVSLESKKDGYKGVFQRSEYGIHPEKYSFRATFLPNKNGQSGKRLLVKFSGWDLKWKGEPYAWPEHKDLIWRIVNTRNGPKLYVPITIRKGKTQVWNTVELEFDDK